MPFYALNWSPSRSRMRRSRQVIVWLWGEEAKGADVTCHFACTACTSLRRCAIARASILDLTSRMSESSQHGERVPATSSRLSQ